MTIELSRVRLYADSRLRRHRPDAARAARCCDRRWIRRRWVAAARIALAQCTQVWGGAGFVLVPHHDGKVDRTILEALVAYDPDYVAISARTIAERESVAPGAS